MKVVVINGFPKSGKDQFVRMCQKIRPNKIHNISLIDAVKTQARALGWNGDKDDKSRKFLSDLKDIWEAYNDGHYDTIKWRIEAIRSLTEMNSGDSKEIIVFVHVREPNDIEKFVKDFNAFTILVRRPGCGPVLNNHADTNVENWNYDLIYDNEGDLIDMEFEARMILNYIDSLKCHEVPEGENNL